MLKTNIIFRIKYIDSTALDKEMYTILAFNQALRSRVPTRSKRKDTSICIDIVYDKTIHLFY